MDKVPWAHIAHAVFYAILMTDWKRPTSVKISLVFSWILKPKPRVLHLLKGVWYVDSEIF